MLNRIAQAFTGNGSKILGAGLAVVGVVVSLFMLHNEGKKAEEAERKLQQSRKDIITGFKDVADDVGRDLSKNVRDFMAQNIDPLIAGCDKQIKTFEAQAAGEQVKSEKLSALLKRTENLIGEIQNA